MKKKLMYIFPFNRGSDGVDVKIDGQLHAMSFFYTTELCTLLPYRKADSFWRKSCIVFISQFSLIWKSLFSDVIYYRYSPFVPLYNLVLLFLAVIRPVWIEYNTVIRYELKASWPWIVTFHKWQIKLLAWSCAKHVAVTGEIRDKEGLPANAVIIPNGYFRNRQQKARSAKSDSLAAVETRIAEQRDKGDKVLIFVGNEYIWNGLDLIAALVRQLNGAFLVVAGPVSINKELENLIIQGKALTTGRIDPTVLPRLYELADFGIGTFALNRKQMTEGCPLKVREYLWFGLPVIMNYVDPLLAESWARGILHRVDVNNLGATQAFIDNVYDKRAIARRAQHYLSWSRLLQKAGVL